MNLIFSFYNEALYRPLLNGLVWFYAMLPWQDLGIAIVVLTLAMRLVLLPLLWRGQQSQKKLASLQPEIKKVQQELKHDREAQGKALMALYATHKVNPFSGCLVLLIQFPILIALFQVFQKGLDPSQLNLLYSFVPNPGTLHPVTLGLIDLSKGNIWLGVVAAITQFFQTKLLMPKIPPSSPSGSFDFAGAFQKQSLYIFPILILVWSYALPSALTLYWTVLNLFGIVQELLSSKLKAKS